MRLTTYTDYSIRLLMFVALRPDRLCTIEEVATAYGISRNHLMKVAQAMGAAGFLQTVRGRGGGLRLGRPARQIRIGDVVRVTEEDMALTACFSGGTNDCVISPYCGFRHVLGDALQAFMAVLDDTTLADIAGSAASVALPLPAPGAQAAPRIPEMLEA